LTEKCYRETLTSSHPG